MNKFYITILLLLLCGCAIQPSPQQFGNNKNPTADAYNLPTPSINDYNEAMIMSNFPVNKSTNNDILLKLGLPFSKTRMDNGSFTYKYFCTIKNDEKIGKFLSENTIRHYNTKMAIFEFGSDHKLKNYLFSNASFGEFNKYELMDQKNNIVKFIERESEFLKLKIGTLKGNVFRIFGLPEDILTQNDIEIWKYAIAIENDNKLKESIYNGNSFFNFLSSNESNNSFKRMYNNLFISNAHTFMRLTFKNNKLINKAIEAKDWLTDEETETLKKWAEEQKASRP